MTLLLVAVVAIAVGATAFWLVLEEGSAAAFFVMVIASMTVLACVHRLFLRWLARPGQRRLKLFVTGGPWALLTDRGKDRNLGLRALLFGLDSILINEDEDEDESST